MKTCRCAVIICTILAILGSIVPVINAFGPNNNPTFSHTKRQQQRVNNANVQKLHQSTASTSDIDSTPSLSSLTIVSKTKVGPGSNGGFYHRIKHSSKSTGTDMTFGLFLPSSYDPSKASSSTPIMFWLSGLTCDDTNFAQKAGPIAFQAANREGIAIVMPDTSPRGSDGDNVDVADDVDSYDLGQGAGFYVDATQEPYAKHYNMRSYVTEELPQLLREEFNNLGGEAKSICGHSMGGHGALSIALDDPESWASVSALSPICNPSDSPDRKSVV